MPDDSHQDSRDRLRLCPTCRMAISVLATKCRYCGEPVGRPRDEQRTLTINDLGGAAGSSYAVGQDVLDAIEAFRQEELTALDHEHGEEEQKGWFGHKKHAEHAAPKGPESKSQSDNLPGLDARHRDLASITVSPKRHAAPVRHERIWTKKLALFAAAVAGILILYFGGLSAKARIDEYLAKRNAKPVVQVENRAIAILARNGPALEALSAAQEALHASDTTENRKVADSAREAVKREVNALLNAGNWNAHKLDQASSLVTKALNVDPGSRVIKELKQEVTDDVCAYKMTISNLDYEGGVVTLRVTYPDRPPDVVVKKKDEVVHNRFRVKRIGPKFVMFEDPLRKSPAGLPRNFSLSVDGTISVQE